VATPSEREAANRARSLVPQPVRFPIRILSRLRSVSSAPQPRRPLSLGVIFLTLYIDLIGFSIIFPLVPDILAHYLAQEAGGGVLGWLLRQTEVLAQALGKDVNFAAVLLGGVLSSIYALLQFVFAPFWGALSDRRGRRGVLLITVAGTAASYLLWAVSGSFWLFIASRLFGGLFAGNISVASAAVADVTSREERSRSMGLIGAAFGLGLVTGPGLGALTAELNLLEHYPHLERWGVHPFTVPALVSLVMSVVNLVWIRARFKETLSPAARGRGEQPRLRHPLRAALRLGNPAVRRINLVAFAFALAFCAMEFSLTFLGAQRFGYTARQNGVLLIFLGVCSIFTQGFLVRRLLKQANETKVLSAGLMSAAAGLIIVGLAPHPAVLYVGLAVLAIGSGLVNPSTSGLISLYSDPSEQGRALGIFRALGSLARALTPILAGAVFWLLGGSVVFLAGAALAIGAWVAARRLPRPER
jgi:MFS family permease